MLLGAKIFHPFSIDMHPIHLMPKPAGSACNLDCTYCYYLEKQKLYAASGRQEMSDELLEKYIHDYIATQPTDNVLFTWHGGEPLMRPMNFYERALRLQEKHAQGKTIENALQTNGTLLTLNWCNFLKDNNFLVGISIDGTQEMHDHYRISRSGRGTWRQVMRGVELLQRCGVDWNAMAVVNDFNALHPLEFYRFFKTIGCDYLQFTPIVERIYRHPDGRLLASPIEGLTTAEMAPFSVSPKAWGNFLCTIFDEWVRHDVGEFFVQIFDSTLAGWMGVPGSLCTMAETCGHATAMEHNGDVYACDHYVFPEFKLGNIMEKSLESMVFSEEQKTFGENKRKLLTQQCKMCEWRFACNGDCPRTRFTQSQEGEWGHPYLCEGWQQYYHHVAPYMDFMKRQLQANLPPANIMNVLAKHGKL